MSRTSEIELKPYVAPAQVVPVDAPADIAPANPQAADDLGPGYGAKARDLLVGLLSLVDSETRFKTLPELAPAETRTYRWTWVVAMAICTVLVAHMVFAFWAPAHPGVDQNGYLVGGRQLAYTGSTRFVPESPYEYVGNMWVMTGIDKANRAVYYPKYPIGLPILYAIPFWLGGEKVAGVYAFLVSPVSSVLTFVGMFCLGRLIAGSFAGMLSAILLVTSQCVLVLMNNANSHASCLAFVVWGMFLAMRWWQTGSIWRGALGGFLLGFACMIRYTEGLLILPIVFAAATGIGWKWWRGGVAVAMFALVASLYFYTSTFITVGVIAAILISVRWSEWKRIMIAAVPGLGWLLPVGYLLVFNWRAMGSLTGYDTTNESGFAEGSFWHVFFTADIGKGAFTWAKFLATWEQMLRTFHDMGLFFVLPLGIAGMALLFRKSWQAGLWAILWLVPGVVLYTSYYWSPDRGVSYARFFTTFFPAILLGFAAVVRFGFFGWDGARRSIAAPIAAGLVVAISAGVGMYRAAQGMEDGRATPGQSLGGMHRQHSSLSVTGRMLADNVPSEAVIIAQDGARDGMLNYGQFMGRWETYSSAAFSSAAQRAARRDPDPNDPNPLQPRRREYLADFYDGRTQQRLAEDQYELLKDRTSKGKRVFTVVSAMSYPLAVDMAEKAFPREKYQTKVVMRWRDQVEPPTVTWSAAFGEYFMGINPAPSSHVIETAAAPAPDNRFGGGGGGGRRGQFGAGGPGGGGGGGGPPMGRGPGDRVMAYALVEIAVK